MGPVCVLGAVILRWPYQAEMAPTLQRDQSQALGCSEQGNAKNAEITSRAAEEDQLGSRGQSHWRTNIRDGQKRKGGRA